MFSTLDELYFWASMLVSAYIVIVLVGAGIRLCRRAPNRAAQILSLLLASGLILGLVAVTSHILRWLIPQVPVAIFLVIALPIALRPRR